MPESRTIVVVATGAAQRAPAPGLVPDGALVVAADGGVDAARALGLEVAVAVGDFDSVTPAGLAAVTSAGGRVERHPTAKDATDLELALEQAIALGAERVVVLADGGGRLDHLAASLLLLGSERWRDVEVDGVVGGALVHVIRRERQLDGEPGELVSLLALHGAATGVTTDGLAYTLRGETLEPGSSRGVSNVFAGRRARVEVERGVVLAIRPGEREETT